MTNIQDRIDSLYGDLPQWKRDEIARNADMFTETARMGDAFVWQSNGSAPFTELTSEWVALGLMTQAEAEATEVLRKEQMSKFLNEYVRRRCVNPVPSAEELFEMRAAFGEGETVVDVITGQRYNL